MTSADELVVSIRAAVAAAPSDVPLRLHLAELLAERGAVNEAIQHVAAALSVHPDDELARQSMMRLLGDPAGSATSRVGGFGAPITLPGGTGRPSALGTVPSTPAPRHPVIEQTPQARPAPFDRSVSSEGASAEVEPAAVGEVGAAVDTWSIEGVDVTLDDVSGTQDALKRVEHALLGPRQQSAIRGPYGRDLGRGVLVYGPPGCGKRLIAQAVAKHLRARFVDISLSGVEAGIVDLAEEFADARSGPATLLYLTDLDAVGHAAPADAGSGPIDRLLHELDQIDGDGEGSVGGDGTDAAADASLLIIASSSAPWDVDPRLLERRRLSRGILVMPPGLKARTGILEREVSAVGAGPVSVTEAAMHTPGYSAYDLVELVRVSAKLHISELERTGVARPWSPEDLLAAMGFVPPSTSAWWGRAESLLDDAPDGLFTGLSAYLRARQSQG